jgi:nicotinamidase/pyrazinamidase
MNRPTISSNFPERATASTHDALLIIDMQKDFLSGGALAVPYGVEVLPVLNSFIAEFVEKGFPIFATRDWHPRNHCSFEAQGGPWPAHCVQGTSGAEFAPALHLPPTTIVISKPSAPNKETYSAFEGTDLEKQLRDLDVRRLFVGGLATEYCVFHTVKDALRRGFAVQLLVDAIRPIKTEDGAKAESEMIRLGATPVLSDVEEPEEVEA